MLQTNSHMKYAWESTRAEIRKPKQRDDFNQNFVDCITNLTLHCYHWIFEPKRSKTERFFWIVVHIIGAVSIISILNWTLEHHMTSPFVTTLYDTAYPISKIGFPGISICPNNVISMRRAKDYAKHLATVDKKGRDIAFHLEGVRNLGKLYDFDGSESFDFLGFQHILDQLDDGFDITAKLKELSPQCDEILMRCVWKGKVVNCTNENKMFRMIATASGHCCVFNSKKIYDNLENRLSISNYGSVSGLVLYLNTSIYDYFYPLLPYIGFQVQVYNPDEVSDQSAGRAEALISSGTETLTKIGATVVRSDDNIRRYSIEKRRCVFSSDNKKIQSVSYFRSNCIRSCRMESIIALCNCIPFFYIDLIPTSVNSTKVCTLDKVPCLSHYNVKWLTPLFSREKDVGVETEFENGLSCLHCLPSCSRIQYSISTTRLPLRALPAQTRNTSQLDVTDFSELIMLRIFYAKPDHFLYRQYIAKNWFEFLSELGGLCGVLIGFSMISAVEVVYFLIRQLYSTIHRTFNNSKLKDINVKHQDKYVA